MGTVHRGHSGAVWDGSLMLIGFLQVAKDEGAQLSQAVFMGT